MPSLLLRLRSLHGWQVYPYGSYADPSEELDIFSDVAKGHVKAAMLAAFKGSSEPHVVLHRKPDQTVFTVKEFKKPGDLELVAFSPSVLVAKSTQKLPLNAQPKEGAMKFNHKGAEYSVYIKPGLQYPKLRAVQDTIVNASPSCIVAYWGVRSTDRTSKVNVKRTLKMMQVSVGTQISKVYIPTFTNTVPLKAKEELLFLGAPEEAEGPPAKKAKAQDKARGEANDEDDSQVATPKRKGKGKGTGKAKGKGKSK